jgi:hypothetical protein
MHEHSEEYCTRCQGRDLQHPRCKECEEITEREFKKETVLLLQQLDEEERREMSRESWHFGISASWQSRSETF